MCADRQPTETLCELQRQCDALLLSPKRDRERERGRGGGGAIWWLRDASALALPTAVNVARDCHRGNECISICLIQLMRIVLHEMQLQLVERSRWCVECPKDAVFASAASVRRASLDEVDCLVAGFT